MGTPITTDVLWGAVGGLGTFGLLFVGSFAWERVRAPKLLDKELNAELEVAKAQLETRARLEVRFGQHEPYKRLGSWCTHYRVGVYNCGPAMAENLELWLMNIEPRPRAPIFNADYPYRVRRASSAKGEDVGCHLNPEHEELFELLWFWMSSPDGEGLMVDGIDTKRHETVRRFPIKPDESWRLTYKVSCANSNPIILVFSCYASGRFCGFGAHIVTHLSSPH